MKVELQVLRNWKAYTRPLMTDWPVTEDEAPFHVKLPAGYAGDLSHVMMASLSPIGLINDDWLMLRAHLTLDGMRLGGIRPGTLYVQVHDMPSCLIHFGNVADDDNETYGGFWTLTVRAV